MKICAIDIGTNTFLLLIANIDPEGRITPLVQLQRMPRIGRSVDAGGRIGAEAFSPAAAILSEFASHAASHSCDVIAACATSAVRDAVNRSDFIGEMERRSGIRIEILSGEEEAALTYRGAVSRFGAAPVSSAVIDIGGGSTEIISADASGTLHPVSLQLGAVRITERFFRADPPAGEELEAAARFVDAAFNAVATRPDDRRQLIAVAGTATTLACFDLGLNRYEGKDVEGYIMEVTRVTHWRNRLSALSSREILSLSSVAGGREDIITAGVMILERAMVGFGFREVTMTERGLRYGIALREFDRRTSQVRPASG